MPATLVVSGVSSGVGKTSIAVGIMAALSKRGMRVQPFKVGPDYLDTMHHTRACGGIPSVNLDGFMMGREAVLTSFHRSCRASRADIAVVEGCMGLFDGRDGKTECGSTAEIAKWLQAPVLLVVDAWCLSRSAAAIAHGYSSFDPDLTFAGVIFNKIGGDSHAQWLREAIQSSPLTQSLSVLGCIPKDAQVVVPERHLGLNMPTEQDKSLDALCRLINTHVDLDQLVQLAAPVLELLPPAAAPRPYDLPPVRFGVAKDEAFCFYYHDNLRQLEEAGATLIYFSPLHDACLPGDLHALYFGGGYPELHAEALQANVSMRNAVLKFSSQDGLIYAECGGLMYLAQQLLHESRGYTMAQVLPFDTTMTPRMVMGYCECTPAPALATLLRLRPSLLLACHQFHFSEVTRDGQPIERLNESGVGIGWVGVKAPAYLAAMVRDTNSRDKCPEGIVQRSTIASYCHLHFLPEFALALVQAARRRMTILSLDPAATETLAQIWATTSAMWSVPHTKMLRGVSEFCDYPPALLRDVPKVTKSLVRHEFSSEEMEAQIQALHAQGIRDLHTIDAALVEAARPGLLLTQDTCDRCGATDSALVLVLDHLALPRSIAMLCRPQTVADILAQVLRIGGAVGEGERAETLHASLVARLNAVRQAVRDRSAARVLGLESLCPLVASGQWLPDMRERAGGGEALADSWAGCAPRRLEWRHVVESRPDAIVIGCCGKSASESAREVQLHLSALPDLWDLPAMQATPCQLYVVDHDFLSRAGPRVISGVELLAAVLHPQQHIAVDAAAANAVLQYMGPRHKASIEQAHFLPVPFSVQTREEEGSGPPSIAAHVMVPWKESSLLVVGGDARGNRIADVWEWSLERRRWHRWTCTSVYGEQVEVPTRRSNHVAAVWKNVLLVFGGWNSTGLTTLAALELLDLSTQCWTHGSTVSQAPSPRGNLSMVVDTATNQAIVFGGWNGQTKFGDVFRLDLTHWRWTEVVQEEAQPSPCPRTDHSAVWWPQAKAMVVFGGTSDEGPLDDVWLLVGDDIWEEWHCSGAKPAPRFSHAAVIHGNVMVISGGQCQSAVLESIYALDLSTKLWTQVNQGFGRVCRHSMAVLGHEIFSFGGNDGSETTNSFQTLNMSWNASSQEKAAEVEEVKAPPTWAPTTPLTLADLEKDETMANELSEIEDMDCDDQASERYRLLHRVACKRGYLQYIDPTSGYTVFTKLFLERRACCGYRCRHCPWGHKNVPKDSKKNLEW